jgi:hypothetical protein
LDLIKVNVFGTGLTPEQTGEQQATQTKERPAAVLQI